MQSGGGGTHAPYVPGGDHASRGRAASHRVLHSQHADRPCHTHYLGHGYSEYWRAHRSDRRAVPAPHINTYPCGRANQCAHPGATDRHARTTQAAPYKAASTADASATDASATDTSATDASATDAGTTSAGTTNAGAPDTRTNDIGTADIGATPAYSSIFIGSAQQHCRNVNETRRALVLKYTDLVEAICGTWSRSVSTPRRC